jgi:hypothetical protein
MKPNTRSILPLLLVVAFACSKNDLTVGPSAARTSSPSMSGGWGITWLGWFANYSGTITGTMTLTEKDSMLSGSIFIHNKTFSVAGSVSSAYEVTLTGVDGGFDYTILGTVDASKSILSCKVNAAHMGTVPRDTAGTAIFSASRYK